MQKKELLTKKVFKGIFLPWEQSLIPRKKENLQRELLLMGCKKKQFQRFLKIEL